MMGDAQRLGAVKGEIERMQQLQSMLDDGYMALELLDEVRCPLSHRGLGSRDASLKKRCGSRYQEEDESLLQEASSLAASLQLGLDKWETVRLLGTTPGPTQSEVTTITEHTRGEPATGNALSPTRVLCAGGAYDEKGAVLQINAGAGGLDAMDWAAMLERMYMRWAEIEGFKVTITERSEGEEKTLKSVRFIPKSLLWASRSRSACV
jgi:hypothetical protein